MTITIPILVAKKEKFDYLWFLEEQYLESTLKQIVAYAKGIGLPCPEFKMGEITSEIV